jgi:hypothetical protein
MADSDDDTPLGQLAAGGGSKAANSRAGGGKRSRKPAIIEDDDSDAFEEPAPSSVAKVCGSLFLKQGVAITLAAADSIAEGSQGSYKSSASEESNSGREISQKGDQKITCEQQEAGRKRKALKEASSEGIEGRGRNRRPIPTQDGFKQSEMICRLKN